MLLWSVVCEIFFLSSLLFAATRHRYWKPWALQWREFVLSPSATGSTLSMLQDSGHWKPKLLWKVIHHLYKSSLILWKRIHSGRRQMWTPQTEKWWQVPYTKLDMRKHSPSADTTANEFENPFWTFVPSKWYQCAAWQISEWRSALQFQMKANPSSKV